MVEHDCIPAVTATGADNEACPPRGFLEVEAHVAEEAAVHDDEGTLAESELSALEKVENRVLTTCT
jgi:hypothetical protein